MYICSEQQMNAMIEEEFAYFQEHQKELYETYPEKYLIIKDKTIVGIADNIPDAMDIVEEKHLQMGTFLLQFCGKDEWAYTQIFHSRASFA